MSAPAATTTRSTAPHRAASGPRPVPGRRRGSGWRGRVPSVAAAVLFLLAVVCAVAAVSEVFDYRFQPVRAVVNEVLVAAPANLGYAALVTVLAFAVAARKRLAWRVLIAYF